MRLHDILFGGNTHGVFQDWWEYAKKNYVQFEAGRPPENQSLYYDPLVDYHHLVGNVAGLMLAFHLVPQKREEARLLFDAAVEVSGWNTNEPVRESGRNLTTLQPTPRDTLMGLALAREFGNDEVYAKLQEHADGNYEPTWNPENGEFTWGFELGEPHPRGQYNAVMMTAEAGSEGAWWRIYNEPNLAKFTEPTVHGVDFPTVCLSQAWYDGPRRRLIVTTDAGAPGAEGKPTIFRIGNVNVQSCNVSTDGESESNWRIVNGELEITTTVGQHTFVITH